MPRIWRSRKFPIFSSKCKFYIKVLNAHTFDPASSNLGVYLIDLIVHVPNVIHTRIYVLALVCGKKSEKKTLSVSSAANRNYGSFPQKRILQSL